MLEVLVSLAYLVAAALFILGLKKLTSPATARAGNGLAALGMLVAVVATLLLHEIVTPLHMLAGLVVGGGIGAVLARRVEMTGMPELVAAFNGFGGLASTLVAGAEVAAVLADPSRSFLDVGTAVTLALSLLIGTITFSGSFVAFGKLSGRVNGNAISFPGMRVLTVLTALGMIAATALLVWGAAQDPLPLSPILWATVGIVVTAFLLGILLVIPIGGADMPVVVALLNSYSGLAAAATGFVLDNTALIVSGALVGASGFVLTQIMCEAMNRSLLNVLLGGFGGEASGEGAALVGDKSVQQTTAEDTAIALAYADRVIVVPGYGMAVAQAQHQVRELAELLAAKGVDVRFAIHPVAGRMPGHMNVLLAEANVPYDQLYEMSDINSAFSNTDVTLVIGANDVVNPAARTDTSSPIYGMPILDVDQSSRVVVLKRSMRPGYSGVENVLFYEPNTALLFGDAKESITDLISAVKEL